MTPDELERLLTQPEGPTLEFKRNVPDLDDHHQRDEFVKDIVALANGNMSVVGETAHLILGVDNDVDSVGQRTYHDVGAAIHVATWRDRLVDILRSACTPPISNVACEIVSIGTAQLVVLTLPVSSVVHETTRELRVKGKERKPRGKMYDQTYSRYTVFMRVGASIEIASMADRDVLRERKQQHFNESNKVWPVVYGAAVGGLTGVSVARGIAQTPPDERLSPNLTAAAMGVFAGGLGAVIGLTYRRVVEFWRQVQAVEHIPPRWRKPVFVGIMGGMIAGAHWVTKLIPVKKQS